MSSEEDHGTTTQAPSPAHSIQQDGKLSPKEKATTDVEEGVTTHHKGPQERRDYDYMVEKQTHGAEKYHKLGWVQLVVVLIVEAIALGSLSMPSAFATLGMVAGVIVTVSIGLICIYTSFTIGQVKLKHPGTLHYSDAGTLLGGQNRRLGRFLYEMIGVMFSLLLVLLVGSHCLTGTIAFGTITNWPVCSLVFGVVSAILLFCLAVPPSFSEMAILGYIDFVSIIAAIIITLIAAGVLADKQPGGASAIEWSAWPKEGATFASAMIAVTNIAFAYSFAVCQFSFMEEMHTPTDYVKSIWTLGILEICIYTITGAVGYALIGPDVQSPALLSASPTISKVAFGVALPVIFISGSINTVVVCRYVMDRAYPNSIIKYVNTKKGWAVWLSMIATVTVVAFVIAEVIPVFSALLGLVSSLLISGFSFWLPGLMWLVLLREGGCFSSGKNTALTIVNVSCIAIGAVLLVGGFYASVVEIIDSYANGTVQGVFTCAPIG